MFGLKVAVCQSIQSPDFDTVNTILSNSSFTKQEAPWCPVADERGGIYYLEAVEKLKQHDFEMCEENTVKEILLGKSHESRNDRNSMKEDIVRRESRMISDSFYSQEYTENKYPDFYRMDNLVQFNVPLKSPYISILNENTFKQRSYIGRFFCKELLGIIPGHFRGSKSNNQRLCIRGLDPTKDVLKKKRIRIGDCLRLVNGQEVTWNNIDEVFTTLCSLSDASIVVQQAPRKSSNMHQRVVITEDSGIVQLLPKATETSLTESLTDNSFAVMYVDLEKLNSEENDSDEDVLYQFPNKCEFLRMRGAFVTTYSTLSEITSPSSCTSTFMYENKLMNVGYHEEDKKLLLVIIPENRVRRFLLSDILGKLIRVIRVQYQTLQQAFSNSANHLSITALCGSLLYQIDQTDPCLSNIHAVQYLHMDSSFLETVDCIVTKWESSDCQEMSESYYGCRRTYTVLGSCLFYKDSLVSNHLPHDDLLDIYLYLQFQHIISLCCQERIQTSVIWREIFPTRQFYFVLEEEPFGYTEPVSARWFWLIVSYKHSVLCTMLETNGYQLKFGMSVAPDPLLVDQAKVTLMQIINLDIYKQMEQYARENTSSLVTNLQDSMISTENETKTNLFTKHRKSKRFFRDSSVRSSMSSDSASSVDSGKQTTKYIYSSDTGFCDLSHGLDLPRTGIKLSVGTKNCLLQYLHVDKHEGFYIKASPTSKMDSKILHNFSLSCSIIKHTFDRYKHKTTVAESDNTSITVGQDPTFRNIREEGVLFSILSEDPNDKSSKSYWVIGRQRSLTETYICFLDGTPQSTLDLAFKLAFGIKPG